MPNKNNNQRHGASSNAKVGSDFENVAFEYFKLKENVILHKNYMLDIGVEIKKNHKFDLGNDNLIVECKSHTWTDGKKVPSAKMSVWNEAMFYFNLVPNKYKKILFVLMDFCQKRCKTLLKYYIEKNYHFIPRDVIFYEYYVDGEYCEIYDFERWKKLI